MSWVCQRGHESDFASRFPVDTASLKRAEPREARGPLVSDATDKAFQSVEKSDERENLGCKRENIFPGRDSFAPLWRSFFDVTPPLSAFIHNLSATTSLLRSSPCLRATMRKAGFRLHLARPWMSDLLGIRQRGNQWKSPISSSPSSHPLSVWPSAFYSLCYCAKRHPGTPAVGGSG